MLQVLEGVQLSATFAEIIYRVDVVGQMSAPTSGAVEEVRDLTNDNDVTGTVMPVNSVTIESTTFVKFSPLQSLTKDHRYSIRFSFSDADNKLAGEVLVDCKF